jgi:hypothetical protein
MMVGFPAHGASPEPFARRIPEIQNHSVRSVIRQTYNATAAILFQRRQCGDSAISSLALQHSAPHAQ